MKEKIIEIAEKLKANEITSDEAQKLLLNLFKKIDFCNCGNPSHEGNCYFEEDESLIYICADCKKQIKD